MMNRNDRRIALAALGVAVVALTALLMTGGEESATAGDVDSTAASNGIVASRGDNGRAAGHDGFRSRYGAATIVYDEHHGKPSAELFPFDPNTADSTTLLRLGLSPYLVRSIYRYRAHGGVFYSKEDFARFRGLTAGDYRRLASYIHIGSDYRPAAFLVAPDTVHRKVKLTTGEHVELNTTDTAKLQLVPGIGPHYSKEIIRYGQRLGGYVSVDQLDEIEGFPPAAKQYFTITAASPVLLNVNRLSINELRRHPYISYFQAKAIVEYRRLHGPLTTLDALRLHRDFPAEAIERLRPYVTF